jgi:hypothetical protein
MIRPAPRDQIPVDVIQVEEPLQLRSGRIAGEPPVRGDLFVAQELHRHESRP